MRNFLLISLFLIGLSPLQAQDAYHQNLLETLRTDYALPDADWVLSNTENAILNDAFSYGASSSKQDETGQPFSRKMQHVISAPGNAPWDAGWGIRNNIAIQVNDIILGAFYIRSVGGEGQVNFFVENTESYNKEVILTLPVSEEWRRYLIPFKASGNYSIDDMTWGFHLAFQAQTIEIGGFTALNFHKDVNLENLPSEINNQFYDGWEVDAPWRAEAASRIEQFRKANLTINVTNTEGNPVERAAISIKMLQHEFAFGTAVTANRLAGNNKFDPIYQDKLINLDGKGHGFNWVVFENDLKWPAWEDEWLVNKSELVNAVQWLTENNIKIRGHNLLWPGENNLPRDIQNNLGNISFIKNRINQHLEEILTWPGLQGQIPEWDILNEIVTNRTLEEAFAGKQGYTTGRELYPEIFQKAREFDANTRLWLNDYVSISLNQGPGNGQYDILKQFTREIVDSSADVEGIGFQSHIGGFPNGIPSVLAIFDDFHNSFGLKAKVTEFDLPAVANEELAANYLRDYLTASFSHPSMNGFFFWNFWDGATWQSPGANFFRLDWRMTPAADTFIDLVFNEWWTDETVTSSASGVANTNVFKGLYELSYESDGVIFRDTINIVETSNYAIVSDNIATDLKAIEKNHDLNIFPIPSNGLLHIYSNSIQSADIRLFDLSGKSVRQTRMNSPRFTWNLEGLKGMYFLEVKSNKGRFVEKVVLQ